MPVQYEHIRDSYAAKGMDYDKAQAIAAATYNKQHPGRPMSAAHPEGSPNKDALVRHLKGTKT
jgi:hypothetical protein